MITDSGMFVDKIMGRNKMSLLSFYFLSGVVSKSIHQLKVRM
jgi:hypothetical protein